VSRYDGTRPMRPAPPGAAGMRRPRDVPAVPGVLEHTLERGEWLDLLAEHYYGDPGRWWWILDANPQVLCGADLREATGRVIVIPRAQP
jgi:nucleoid-associated protein YgaU